MFHWTFWLAFALFSVVVYYAWWQANNLRIWQELKRDKSLLNSGLPAIAVVVAYRNESDHLPDLLASLRAQTYANFSVVLVDDHSTDEGAGAGAKSVVKTGIALHHLSLADHVEEAQIIAHKKAALRLGIEHAEADIIFTTDADCELPPDLLERLAQAFTPDIQVVLGPVFNAPLDGFCDHFQALDLTSYQFLTAVSIARKTPTLANGACFAFRRPAFLEVDGYAGVDHLPSGDDVLLLHKFRAALPPTAFQYLLDGTPVTTKPVKGWRALWRQRLRWAGKAGNYRAPELEFAQVLAFGANLAIIALLLLALHPRPRLLLLPAIVLKLFIDYRCLRAICRHYGKGDLLRWYLATAVMYPFFLVGVGTAALLGFQARWKGR